VIEQEVVDIKTQAVFKMTIQYTGEAQHGQNHRMTQALNFILKGCMRRCGFVPFGKNQDFFDFKNLMDTTERNVKMAAGYRANIGFFADRYLLSAEITHKILSENTLLEEIRQIVMRNSGDQREALQRELIGSQVLTT
jgi:hypothetical protein